MSSDEVFLRHLVSPRYAQKITLVLIHATCDVTLVANELTQINTLVSEQGYYELGWGYLWTSGLCGPS